LSPTQTLIGTQDESSLDCDAGSSNVALRGLLISLDYKSLRLLKQSTLALLIEPMPEPHELGQQRLHVATPCATFLKTRFFLAFFALFRIP
jgi:hypothetical protein